MAKQIIDTFNMKAPFSKAELDYIEKIRLNPKSEEYIELWIAGVV